ncbi:hypothetical protein [Pseudanabaena minima]|uniref:hypothetical protein n=1 Tax=Pseudanabaena minima TaxID=890415 RepID=UPI003DA7FCCB
MNYRKIFAMTLVVLVQACGISSTKAAIDQPISGGVNTQITSNPTPTSTPTQSNSSSIGNASIETKSLEVEKLSQANLPASCSKEEYRSFFEQFVRGKDNQGNEIRYPFTSPYIQVRDYQDPSKLIETMSRKNDEFSIDLRDYQWVQLVPSTVDNSPYTRLKIDIQKIDDKTFRVDYIKAQYKYEGNGNAQEESLVKTYGAPNAYIFEHRNGCWYLTQKLQSSL